MEFAIVGDLCAYPAPRSFGSFCHLRNAFKSVSQFVLLLFVSCAHCRLNYLAIVKAAAHTHIQTHTFNAWLHLIEITVANTQNTQQKRCNSTCCAASFPANVLARLQLATPALTSLCPPSSFSSATPAVKHNKNTDVRQQAPQTAPHRTPLLLLRLRRLAARQHWHRVCYYLAFLDAALRLYSLAVRAT